jgi:hypothetical protein
MNLRYSIPFVSIYLTPNASAACYCDRNSIYNNNDNEFLDDENLFEIQKKNAFPLWVNFGRLKLSRCFEHVVNLAHLHRFIIRRDIGTAHVAPLNFFTAPIGAALIWQLNLQNARGPSFFFCLPRADLPEK